MNPGENTGADYGPPPLWLWIADLYLLGTARLENSILGFSNALKSLVSARCGFGHSGVVHWFFSHCRILEPCISVIFFFINSTKLFKHLAGFVSSLPPPSARAAWILRNIAGPTAGKYLKENCGCRMLVYILLVTFQVLADSETKISSNR